MINRIKEARKARHLTQEELADKLQNEQVNISNWERGVKEPNFQTLVMIADILNVTIDYLLCRETVPRVELSIDDNEKELLESYRMLDEKHKEAVRGFATQQLDNQLLMRGMAQNSSCSSAG